MNAGRRSRLARSVLATGLLVVAGCTAAGSWRAELDDTLPLLGHRNWIVVVDSAYPLQTSPGLRVVWAEADMLAVVERVLAAVDGADHVRATVFLDRELALVTEADAPGIEAWRAALEGVLEGREARPLPHEELIATIGSAAADYEVLVLKTPLTLPYTSVFVRLDCGYWSDQAEARLGTEPAQSPPPPPSDVVENARAQYARTA